MKHNQEMRTPLFENVMLETPRLSLRSFTVNDKDEFYSIIQDPEIYKTLPEDHMYDRDEVADIIDFFLESYAVNTPGDVRKFPLAIALKSENRIIGNVGIGRWSADESEHEIFYFLNSLYWTMGYASEAVSILLAYVKAHKLVPSLVGTVVPGNTASVQILKKNGFYRVYDAVDNHARDVYRSELK